MLKPDYFLAIVEQVKMIQLLTHRPAIFCALYVLQNKLHDGMNIHVGSWWFWNRGIDNQNIKHHLRRRIMKKLASVCAGLLLLISASVFAEKNHVSAALEHANAAAVEGKAGKPEKLVEHAKLALEHALAGAIVAKSIPKNHLDEAAKELQEAIDHGNLDHSDVATKHVDAAIEHINKAK